MFIYKLSWLRNETISRWYDSVAGNAISQQYYFLKPWTSVKIIIGQSEVKRQFWLTIIENMQVDQNNNNLNTLYLLVSTVDVLTSSMDAGVGGWATLVDVEVAISSVETLSAGALVTPPIRLTPRSIATWLIGAVIFLIAVGSSPATWTRALVRVESGESARATIVTGTGVTSVAHTCLTQRVLVAKRTLAPEAGSSPGPLDQDTCSTILTNLFSSVARVPVLTILSCVLWWTPEM